MMGIAFILFQICYPLSSLWAEEGYVKRLETPVHDSIETRQKSQKEADKWEEERLQLQAEYDKLTNENEMLSRKVETLTKQEASQKALNASLIVQEQESRRIAEEITPYTEKVYSRIERLVHEDLPFLKDEREQRVRMHYKIT